jgi:hypothetical protein
LSKGKVRQIAHFCFKVHHLLKHSGAKGTVLYLKASQVLLQQGVGRHRVHDLAELKVRPKRTRAGLPRIIPAGARKLIREGDLDSIRLWMTLLGFFRIMDFKGKLSFSTIVDPCTVVLTDALMLEWEKFIYKHFLPTLELLGEAFKPLEQPQPFKILKSGPTAPSASDMELRGASSSFFALVSAAKI